MKIIGKAIIPLFLVTVFLTSCNNLASPTSIRATDIAGTAMVIVKTSIIETQGAIPTITFTPQLPTIIPPTPLPPTETPTPIKTPLPISGTPTAITMENGLTWSECVVPNHEYSVESNDLDIPTRCIDIPIENESDRKRKGERIKYQNATSDWRITIRNDYFETKIDDISKGCCSYRLLKNGETILKMSPGFMTSNPNRGFWNIGGKLVWELGGYISVIVVDGVNYNEKYGLEGSYFPYEIKGKLIYIAKKNGIYHIVYDDKNMGPDFDDIQMAYCCSGASVYHGSGHYWFLGRRAGTKYVVSIH